MNRVLMFSSVAILILEMSSVTEVSAYTASAQLQASGTAARHAVRSNSVDRDTGESCTTRIFAMTKSDGSRTIRYSVDCEE
jgi:hypothetical protein